MCTEDDQSEGSLKQQQDEREGKGEIIEINEKSFFRTLLNLDGTKFFPCPTEIVP